MIFDIMSSRMSVRLPNVGTYVNVFLLSCQIDYSILTADLYALMVYYDHVM